MIPPVAVNPDTGGNPTASVPLLTKVSKNCCSELLTDLTPIFCFLSIYEGYAMRTIPEPPLPLKPFANGEAFGA